MNDSPSTLNLRLGELLVCQGFITREELERCLRIQRMGSRALIGEIFVEQGYIKREHLHLALALQERIRSAQHIVIPGYEILGKIGEGAMAKVYRAREVRTDRIVAVKILSCALANDTRFVERFLREAHALTQMRHPHIVEGYGVGTFEGLMYCAMEYVDGVSLVDLLHSRGPLPEKECARIGLAVARALGCLYRHKIVHRDIKPQNILLTDDGQVKLCDLGCAKRMDDSDPAVTLGGTVIGTPNYVSPEMIRGEKNIDIQADIYSLGATLYELATGQPPFSADTLVALLMKHVVEPPLSPRRIVPGLSECFSNLLLRCLEKKAEDRYSVPSSLEWDLAALVDGIAPIRKDTESILRRPAAAGLG